MNKQRRSLCIYVCLLALTLFLSGYASAQQPAGLQATAPATMTPTPQLTAALTELPSLSVTPTALAPSASSEAATPTAAATTVEGVNPAGNSKDICLACHGPFDKLAAATANYNAWPNGETTTPHRYVPHTGTDREIPECSNCHKPHPQPPTASDIAAMAKPDYMWCFTCHHAVALECGTCHD